MERIKNEPYRTGVQMGDRGQQGYKLIYYLSKPPPLHLLLWLILILVCDGVFDETTANQHRWLLVIQSKTSCMVRAG